MACFDTAFHRGHPEVADRYALPDALYQEGVRRYGFHGLSYEYIARTLPRVAPEIAHGAVVVAHLGNGASMCAIRDGRSVDSTMGFTALDGLPMGTRCGQLDPGVVLYLLIGEGLERRGGRAPPLPRGRAARPLGVSNDVRDLLASDAPGARLALDYFVYRIDREIGSLGGALGGLDALVLTAGIGENSPGHPRPRLRPRRVARRPAGRGRQSRRWPAHFDPELARVGLGDPDRRGADDRRAHARRREPTGVMIDDQNRKAYEYWSQSP